MKFNHIIDLDNTYQKSKIWFSSDFHLFHANAIKHASRPYANVQENYDAVMKEINDKVKPEDFLILLGDTIWNSQRTRITNFFLNLPTHNIIYLFGNHDREKDYREAIECGLFLSAGRLEHVKFVLEGESYEVSLCYYPLLTWNRKHFGAIMLHGHCHGAIDDYNESVPDLRVDVGWDSKIARNRLIELREIIEYFKQKTKGQEFAKWNSENRTLD